MKVLRQNSGIDMAKDTFHAGFTTTNEEFEISQKRPKMFKNNLSGYEEFLKWIEDCEVKNLPMHFTMEATGVYYEGLAYFLKEKGKNVSVLLPNVAKKFAESLNIKSKTDKIDAKTLGQLGVERSLPEWKLSSEIYRELKTLTRERQRLVENRTAIKNQLHAEEHTAHPMKTTMTRMKKHIQLIDKQIASIENELRNKVSKEDFLSDKIKKITTIPGISFLTVVTIVAETQGFDNFTSIRQLSSFAGYDVRLKESGKFKGKTRISKKGNSHIRRAMYMPSLSTIRHSQTYKNIYDRLYEKKGNGLIAGTAVQRKLLGLIYTLWKNDTEFDENYQTRLTSGNA